MGIKNEPKSIDQQPKHSKFETPRQTPINDSKELVSRALEEEQTATKKRDDAEIAKIRISLGLDQMPEQNRIKQHLQKRLCLKEGEIEKIELLKTKNLPGQYKTQHEALHDERLDGVIIAVIPDDLWIKGSQPSESNAEKQLISIRESYFEAQKNPDEIAWLCHELAHCQNFLDSKTPKEYQKNMQKFAFKDLNTEYTYPNNPVEQFAFTKQFKYLKKQGNNRENILTMISKYYDKEDFPFFNRLLDDVYKK